jgi:hypothetical protein
MPMALVIRDHLVLRDGGAVELSSSLFPGVNSITEKYAM